MSLDSTVAGVVNSKHGDNIAFGISAALAQRVVPRLIGAGAYDHSYIGVTLETVTPSVARADDVSEPRGLLVVQTVPGGPADGTFQPSEIGFVGGSRMPVGGDIVLAVEGTISVTASRNPWIFVRQYSLIQRGNELPASPSSSGLYCRL